MICTEKISVKKVFSSSFIQYWYCENWSMERWAQELKMLKDIGIYEIIIQETADTKKRYAVYPTQIKGYSKSSIDMVKNALCTADSLGMKVRIGLGFNNDWWIRNAFDMGWLSMEASENKKIAKEIWELYRDHESFGGWYIPHEFSQATAPLKLHQKSLNFFLKQITSEIRSFSSEEIMIAPFYNYKYFGMISPRKWTKMLEVILKNSGVDIVNMQDSVGAGFNTLDQAEQAFKAARIAANSIGFKLYADIETFTSKSSGNISAPQSRIEEQIRRVYPYVEGYSAFSINHYQNRNEADQAGGYNAYYNYYQKNK